MKSTIENKQSNTSKTKIAFVYDAIYPYTKGGGERRYYELAIRLSRRDHEVHLYGMKLWKGHDVIQRDGIYLHGICPSKPLYTKAGRRSIWQAIYFGISCLKLIKADFDIIDCCGFPYFSVFSCKLVALLKHKRMYSTYYEVWGKDYWKEYLGNLWFFGYLVERLGLLAPDRIISVSQHTTNKLEEALSSTTEIVTVPMGIDYEAIQKVQPSRNRSDIIFAGRLLSHKHVDILIRSVLILQPEFPNIACYIVGEGPEKADLIRLTQGLSLENNITFFEFCGDHDALLALIKSSRVFVLPSTREGFGIVVLEANACGIPVITTNHKDNASQYLINGKNGIVCGLDENEIARSIVRLLKSNISSTDAMNVAKSHDWNNVTNQIETAYTNV